MRDVLNAGLPAIPARPTSVAGNRSRLMKACRQVEGIFLSRLMEAMDRPTFGEGGLGDARATALFRTRRNRALADEMGLRGQLGLAQMLYNDLTSRAKREPGPTGGEALNHATSSEGAEIR